MSVTETADDMRIDRDAFVEWAERQLPRSISTTARIIKNDEDEVRFRLREERDAVHDIILHKGREADMIHFEASDIGDDEVERRSFSVHRRNIRLTDKTLIVETKEGREICRAGTYDSRSRRGAFPI